MRGDRSTIPTSRKATALLLSNTTKSWSLKGDDVLYVKGARVSDILPLIITIEMGGCEDCSARVATQGSLDSWTRYPDFGEQFDI